jgi:RND family efflux transporter MFP subunit
MKRTWIGVVVVAAAVLALGVWVIRSSRAAGEKSESSRESQPQAVEARVMTVGEVTVPRTLVATGVVRSELEAQLAAKVMGRVVAVYAREGDFVRRGQALIRLDARDLDAAVSQAGAGLRSASVGYDSARVAAQMEEATSAARIASAQAQVAQSEAAVKAARAKLDLVSAGPRRQERTQASLAVNQARANLALAETNLRRYQQLVAEGAVSQQQYDQAKTQYDVAKAQLDTAVQAQSMTDEGSRVEEIRAAQEGLQQAQATLDQARAGLRQAQAMALQVNVRRQEVTGALAQIGQSKAALRLAAVTRDFAIVSAPFDGIVTARLADPGAMAAPGVPLMKVQGGQIRLEAVVPEGALGAVRLGSRVPLTLDALGAKPIVGSVVEVAPQGDPTSHTFLVKIALPAGAGARAGMFGRANLAVGAERRLLVPASAILEREGLQYVFVVDKGNTARLRLVTVGEPQDGMIPVLSGLNSGERIATTHIDTLTDGATVVGQ